MLKNILITGISGFVGTNLVNYFSKYPEFGVYGLDIVFPEIEAVEKIYSWDKLKSIKNIDIVIHLAGKAHDLKNISDEQSYFDINYGLTKKIYDWFLNSSATKFFMMSSVKAVADVVEGDFLSEEDKPNPVTAYGRSKKKAEEYICGINLPEGKSSYIFRPCMIHGLGNKGNMNLLYKFVKTGIPYPLGAFENNRSFLNIDNLCFIFKEFIDKDINSGIYQLADDEALSSNELVALIAETLHKKTRIWNVSPKIIQLLAKMGDLLKLPFNNERLKKITESYIVANEKLKTVLSIEEMPYTAIEGMKKTIKSFR